MAERDAATVGTVGAVDQPQQLGTAGTNQAGNAEEKAFWQRTLEEKVLNEGDLPHAISLLEKHDVLRKTIDQARLFGHQAAESLKIFPATAVREAMLESLTFVIERDFLG